MRYSIHAQAVMAERGISEEWVEAVLAAPEWTAIEPRSPCRYLVFGRARRKR
ncbi:MAG: DUF4258 domain-containing protein [Rhodospirillales bacterium]|nr:DUF4258 domain-containing protein [Rhodospirillales bacterium]